MLNLDTHVLLHAVAGRLTTREDAPLRGNATSSSPPPAWCMASLSSRETSG